MSNPTKDRFLRVSEIIGDRDRPGIVPLSRSAWYQLVREGKAPAPVKLGRAALWRASEIEEFITSAGR